MSNFFTFTAIVTFVGCLLVGCLYAWLLYATDKKLSVGLKRGLFALRTFVVALILWLIFAPLVKQVAYVPEKPIIVLAQDNSISVKAVKPANFNQQQYEANMQALARQLSAKYDVKTYSFSDTVQTGLDFTAKGKLSNATALVHQINDELLNRNVGAVIIASDGIFNRGGNPLYELNKIKAPIYTIALGDTIPKRDVLIANINYNNLVYLDNEFTLEIQVQAFESNGETTLLTVLENGKKVKEQPIKIANNSFVKEVQVKLKANKIGVQKYTVSLSQVKNEITTKNNTQTIFVEVIDGRQKVLIASEAPHPDIAAFKQTIANNKHYEVTVAIGDELEAIDPKQYSLAILYQLPGTGNSALPLLNKLNESQIALWYVIGAQSNLTALNQLQKAITFGRTNGALKEILPYQDDNFTAYQIAPELLKQIANYAPLQVPFASLSVNGNYQALLKQKIGKVNTQSPLLFFTVVNNKKIGFLVGEGIWKWKLEEAKSEQSYPLVNELIAKTVQYLAVKDDKRKFKVYSSKSTYEENENVILNATLYNDAFEAVNGPEVKVIIKNDVGKQYNYTFSANGLAYRLDAGTLPQGNYTYEAAVNLGNQKYTAKGAFYINALIAEYQQTTANHQLLNTMAAQSNGKMIMPANVLSIADELEKSGKVKTISYEDRKYEQLINLKWLFGLIIILWSTEWFFRKRNGEV